MATRYIDPEIMTPAAVTGRATIFPDVIEALVDANNLTAGTDASYLGTIAAAGALDVTKRVIAATVTGTTAYTLANGSVPGQTLTVYFASGASIPNATITPATPSGYATVTAIGAAGDSVTFLWTGSAWVIFGAIGVTFT